VRAFEIVQEKAATRTGINNILSSTNILMGFECEGVAYSNQYDSIEDSMMDDENYSDIEDHAFQEELHYAVEEHLGFSVRSKVAKDLGSYLGVNCKAYDMSPTEVELSKGGRQFMDYSRWGVLVDGSVTGRGVPLEIVSTPYPVSKGLQMLDGTFNFMREQNISTNDSTGLHVTLSIHGKSSRDFDFLKMMIFYDESNAAKMFDRLGTEFCKLMRTRLASYIGDDFQKATGNQRDVQEIIAALKKHGEILRAIFDKYYTIRAKDNGLFEFRVLGGADYELRFAEIRKQVFAMANIMQIGSDPNLHAQEYIKKVFAVLNQDKFKSPTQKKPAEPALNKLQQAKAAKNAQTPPATSTEA
jgi:hypothetical protein